jgi:hypothetical protein
MTFYGTTTVCCTVFFSSNIFSISLASVLFTPCFWLTSRRSSHFYKFTNTIRTTDRGRSILNTISRKDFLVTECKSVERLYLYDFPVYKHLNVFSLWTCRCFNFWPNKKWRNLWRELIISLQSILFTTKILTLFEKELSSCRNSLSGLFCHVLLEANRCPKPCRFP